MNIDISKASSEGDRSGEFSYEYEPDDICMIPHCEIEGSVEVCGSYEMVGVDRLEVFLKIAFTISGSCSYCLGPASKRIESEDTVTFSISGEDDYPFDGKRLNPDEAVRDLVIFSQPGVLLCEDCEAHPEEESDDDEDD